MAKIQKTQTATINPNAPLVHEGLGLMEKEYDEVYDSLKEKVQRIVCDKGTFIDAAIALQNLRNEYSEDDPRKLVVDIIMCQVMAAAEAAVMAARMQSDVMRLFQNGLANDE